MEVPSLRPFVFLNIPPEIRSIIYHHLLSDRLSLYIHESYDESTETSACRITTSSGAFTGLISTCKTIAQEACSSLHLTRLIFTTDAPIDLSHSDGDARRPSTADTPPVDLAALVPQRHRPTITTLFVQSLHIHRLLPIPSSLRTVLPQLDSLQVSTNFEGSRGFITSADLHKRYCTLRDSGNPWSARGLRRYTVDSYGHTIWNNVFPRHFTDVVLAMESGWQEVASRTQQPVQHDTFCFGQFHVLFREFLLHKPPLRLVDDVIDVTYDFWRKKILDVRQGDWRYLGQTLTLKRADMWTRQTVPNVVIPTLGEMETMAETMRAVHKRQTRRRMDLGLGPDSLDPDIDGDLPN